MPDSKHKKVWREMCHRCHNKDRKDYAYYGARGITVCGEWRDSYLKFKEWSLKTGYKEGLTLERKDNNKGYCPNNCTWATRAEQAINRRIFKNNLSGYTGVSYHKKNNNWVVNINIGKKRHHLGSYSTIDEALNARNTYIIQNNLPHEIQKVKHETN